MNYLDPRSEPEKPETVETLALLVKGEEILSASTGATAVKLLAQAEKAGVEIRKDPEKTGKMLGLKKTGAIPSQAYFLIGEVLNFLSRADRKIAGESEN